MHELKVQKAALDKEIDAAGPLDDAEAAAALRGVMQTFEAAADDEAAVADARVRSLLELTLSLLRKIDVAAAAEAAADDDEDDGEAAGGGAESDAEEQEARFGAGAEAMGDGEDDSAGGRSAAPVARRRTRFPAAASGARWRGGAGGGGAAEDHDMGDPVAESLELVYEL